jgi:beta-lactamase class A
VGGAVHRALLLLAACAALARPLALSAAGLTEAQIVTIVLSSKTIPSDLFAPIFLSKMTAERVTSIRDEVTAPLGTFEHADGGDGKYVGHYSHGTVIVLVHLDPHGKIDGLFLREPQAIGASLPVALQPLAALPGASSYLVLENGREIAARSADEPLGVGSTFKLAILNALRREIDAGTLRWNTVVDLDPAWKSLPSGVLQDWPDHAPLTIATLAIEMISISDNTAADALAHVVGPAAIAPFAAGNEPFMTTREMFLLKSKKNAALRARYLSADARGRQAVLAELDRQPLPNLEDFDTNPALAAIEWHFSNRELCALMQGVHDLPLMSVNPGVASRSQWKQIAYKGGSDFGAISMTTWLEAKDGTTYCVSATWNDEKDAVDDTKFATLYGVVLSTLAQRSRYATALRSAP